MSIRVRFEISVLFVIFVTATLISPTGAECCQEAIPLIPNCYSAYGCFEYICADGTPLGKDNSFCGFGACNLFGCDCNGGCRRNSKGYDEEEARRLYHLRNKKPN